MEETISNKKLITVDPEDWAVISRQAFDLGMDRSALVRRIVRSYLEDRPRIEPEGKPTRKRNASPPPT